MLGASRARMGGFSLVELMIGLVAGLILIGSVLAFVAANIQNNSLVVRDIRVTQESRALTDIIVRDLRRNGFVGNSMRMVGAGFTNPDFQDVVVLSSSCIAYGYDANTNGVADPGEFRLFSRGLVDGHGAVFRKLSEAAIAAFTSADCGTGEQISSDDIDVQCLAFRAPDAGNFNSDDSAACYLPATKPSPAISITQPDGSIYISMRLGLVGSQTSSRRTEAQVMVRSPAIALSP